MEIREILNGTFNKIYHIADIHIRNTIYHQEEYKYVFNELYKYIQETKTDNSLIVICGDILHNEQINNISEILCIDFFKFIATFPKNDNCVLYYNTLIVPFSISYLLLHSLLFFIAAFSKYFITASP